MLARMARCSAALLVGAMVGMLQGCEDEGGVTPPVRACDGGCPGEAVYASHCALCHGTRGEGYRADNANALSNQDFLSTATDTFLQRAVEEGRPGTSMSAWSYRHGGPLSDRQVLDLVALMRGWQSVPSLRLDGLTIQGDPGAAIPVYAEHCARCHGDRGQGVTALSLRNPVFLATASDGYLRYAIARGRRGTDMQGYDRTLSPADLDNLTALLRSWGGSVDGGVPPVDAGPPPVLDAGPPRLPDRYVLNERGPAPTFTLREGRFVPAAQVYTAYTTGRRMIIIDARPPSDFARAHIPGAINVPFYDPGPWLDGIVNDGTWIIAYCGCPHAESGTVVDALRARGFPHTAVLDEGVFYWQNQGYPMVGSLF